MKTFQSITLSSVLLFVVLAIPNLCIAQPDTLWTRTFGGVNSDIGNSIQQTQDGGYIVIGTTLSYGSGSQDNVWLIKTDENGDAE